MNETVAHFAQQHLAMSSVQIGQVKRIQPLPIKQSV